jgi:AcrR family transcriptional regulator
MPVAAASRRDPLTRDDIVGAALRITADGGLDRVTMRAVAAELGVTPMALYHHVDSKQALVELVVADIQAMYPALELGAEGWEASFRRYLIELWEVLARYPGLTAHLVVDPQLVPSSVASDFFEQAGFPPKEAHLVWAFALTYLHGRLHIDARMRGGRIGRSRDLRARDFVEFGVDAVIAGIKGMLPG